LVLPGSTSQQSAGRMFPAIPEAHSPKRDHVRRRETLAKTGRAVPWFPAEPRPRWEVATHGASTGISQMSVTSPSTTSLDLSEHVLIPLANSFWSPEAGITPSPLTPSYPRSAP
jgi:hypothetical protein